MSTRANSSSFQLKMKQISDVAAIPGSTTGTMIETHRTHQPGTVQ